MLGKRKAECLLMPQSNKGTLGTLNRWSPFWDAQLGKLDAELTAIAREKLDPTNPLGYAFPRKLINRNSPVGQALSFRATRQHEQRIILVQIGDFYHAYGIDALLLAQYDRAHLLRREANELESSVRCESLGRAINRLVSQGLEVAVLDQVRSNDGTIRRTISAIHTASTVLPDANGATAGTSCLAPLCLLGIVATLRGYHLIEAHWLQVTTQLGTKNSTAQCRFASRVQRAPTVGASGYGWIRQSHLLVRPSAVQRTQGKSAQSWRLDPA